MNTPNMQLTLPVVSTTPGPAWANQINADLATIDGHNHTSGFGAPIPAGALNIDDDLSFHGFDAYDLLSVRFQNRSGSQPVLDSGLYVYGGNLWYNNSAGDAVQLTLGSSIVGTAGSIIGLPSGDASASYLSGEGAFKFLKTAFLRASVLCGPLNITDGDGSNAMIITPSSITDSWTLTLPPGLPVSRGLMAIGDDGYSSISIPNGTLTLTSSTIGVATGGISATQLATSAVETAKIQNGAVTGAKLAAVVSAVSSSCGDYTIPITVPVTFATVTNLVVTINLATTRPVVLTLQNADSNIGVSCLETDIDFDARINISGANSAIVGYTNIVSSALTLGDPMRIPLGSFCFVYFPSATGSTTFSFQARTGGGVSKIVRASLVAYQL